MMLVFVLSIICKMALYMIYANFAIYMLSINFDGHIPLFESVLHNSVPLLLLSLVAALAYLLNKFRPSLRFVPLALFPLSFYMAHDIAAAIFLALPLVYLTVKIAKRAFSVEAEGLQARVKSLAALAFVPLLIVVFGGLAMLSSVFYFHYVIIFVASVIGILRLARGNEAMLSQPKFVVISLIPVAVAAFLILVSQQIAGVIWRVIQFVVVSLIVPLVLFVGNGIEWFFSLFYTHDPDAAPPIHGDGYGIQNDLGDSVLAPPETEGIHITVLAGIATILIAILAYRVLKAILRSKRQNTKKGLTEERRQVAHRSEKKHTERRTAHKHGLLAPRDPRMAVRYHYRQFLKLCAEKGNPPKKGDTSKEIYLKNRELFSQAAMTELRALYLKARYSEEEIKKSESKQSSELLKRL